MFDSGGPGRRDRQRPVVDRFCDYLGAGVTNIVNALAPEVILIGGGISRPGGAPAGPGAPVCGAELLRR